MPLADAGTLAGHDFSKGGNVAAERIRIFIIDDGRIDAAKMTRSFFFLLMSHNWGSRVPMDIGIGDG